MDDDHAPVGLLISALGAVALALSLFAPWYGLTVTQAGTAAARQELATVANQYGNAALQAQVNSIEPRLALLSGHQVATVSAHESLRRESLILLVLAGTALLASLLRLANLRGLFFATGRQITLVGGLAFAFVFYRVLFRPGQGLGLITFSPSWGIWLALLSATAVVAGGLAAGSDRVSTRLERKHGPGPPTLATPPSIRELSQVPPSPRASRRR